MHTHEWSRLSSHATSEGQVVYVRCDCGAHSVELHPRAQLPVGLTVAVIDRPSAWCRDEGALREHRHGP